MKFSIAVTDTATEQERTVVAEFADFIAWETVNDKSLSRFEVDMKLRDLTWLAWHSEKRRKVTSADFEVWLESVAMIRPVADGDVIVPLESQAHTG
jgi:hypothetical protein